MYCAIIGDIIDSRNINDRYLVQEKYKSIFKIINEKFNEDVVAYFKVRDGDGFHGLLKNPKSIIEIITLIKLAIAPYQVRIGIGFGDISTKIDKLYVENIDGTAYVLARKGIDYIMNDNSRYESVYRTTLLQFDNSKLNDKWYAKVCKTYLNLINTIFCACSSIDKNWDSIYTEAIYLKMQNKTQREIASELGISQSSVQNRINKSNYYTYEYYLNSIQSAIDELWEQLEHV